MSVFTVGDVVVIEGQPCYREPKHAMEADRFYAEEPYRLEAWTDGSNVDGNPGWGGWAACVRLFRGGELVKERLLSGDSGGVRATNQQMEMTAAIEALLAIKKPTPAFILLHTDSQYVLKGVCYWSHRWEASGWKTREGRPVKNRTLWEQLVELDARHRVGWVWVRGHRGTEQNERVDALARQRATALRMAQGS